LAGVSGNARHAEDTGQDQQGSHQTIEGENGEKQEPFELPYSYEAPPGRRNKATDDREPGENSSGLIPTSGYPYPYPFDYFNPVQSEVYSHKDNSNNMIVSASTSAGKTIAAELLMDSTLHKDQRIIYLSPLKTLTEEKYAEWQKRYPEETIAIMTGDYLLSTEKMDELLASRIVVMTSEMMDSRTRKFESERNQWMQEVGLVVVDESHILTNSRGDAVETGIMRFTQHCPQARILFLSATMPNCDELGDWLTSLNGKNTDLIQSDWRPVKLEIHAAEYTEETNHNGWIEYWPTEFKKIQMAVDLVLSKPEEKFLVFVHSKKTGRYLLNRLDEHNVNVSYHNADLDRRERMRIEKSFKDRNNGIRVLVSTSTNAWGVNLPARNVVIVGVHRGLEIVDELDIIQMAGRAGRYNIDTEGHVYLIVPAGEAGYWTGIFSNPRPVMSVLNDPQKLAFHILAEIYRKAITLEADLFCWYERSLAFRQGKMPFSRAEAAMVLQDLEQLNMIRNEGGKFQVTGLGFASAVMYYSPYDIHAWYKNFSSVFKNRLETNDELVAWAIGNIPKYSAYVPKEYEEIKDRWKTSFLDSGLNFDEQTVLYMEAVFNCLRGTRAQGHLRSKMAEIKSDALRIINTLRMIDQTNARWNQNSFWENLESTLARSNKRHPSDENSRNDSTVVDNKTNPQNGGIGSRPSKNCVSESHYDEADNWGDADWAQYLGCDKDEVDQYFENQM